MKKFCVLLVIFLSAGISVAQQAAKSQETSPKKEGQELKQPVIPTYRLAFSIFELQDGKRTNQRDYSLLLQADDRGGNKMKIGSKIPLEIGKEQFTYTDVGFDLECSAFETLNNKLSVRVEWNVSSFPIAEQNADPRSVGNRPVLRSISQRLHSVLTPGKPQIITSMDDVNTNKRFQVEVTATKVD